MIISRHLRRHGSYQPPSPACLYPSLSISVCLYLSLPVSVRLCPSVGPMFLSQRLVTINFFCEIDISSQLLFLFFSICMFACLSVYLSLWSSSISLSYLSHGARSYARFKTYTLYRPE